MIDKKQAIEWIESIQNGSGVSKGKVPFKIRGEIAVEYWHDPIFSLGMEYGYILCLIELFGITVEDLGNSYE